jgi:hypothetical protein
MAAVEVAITTLSPIVRHGCVPGAGVATLELVPDPPPL